MFYFLIDIIMKMALILRNLMYQPIQLFVYVYRDNLNS